MNHLCIGCGLCAAVCPQNQIQMVFSSQDGYYRPSFNLQQCETKCGLCEQCCPFVSKNPTTTTITSEIFKAADGIYSDEILGFYIETYEGYSDEHRNTSSSGGLLTWLIESLLKSGEIDGAICVGASSNSPTLFDFKVCHSTKEIRNCAGSCYQPVELSGALRELKKHPDRRYAIVALPCYAKGLRLAMRNNPGLRSQIRFILGLVCGQMKSRNFVDYLCLKYAGRNKPSKAFFRCKRPGKPANNYAYRFTWSDNFSIMAGWAEAVSRPWKERWFTLEACDYCDDVFAECADATFMDAWLPEYSSDPAGRNLVIIRNLSLSKMLRGQLDGAHLNRIEAKRVIESQKGVIHQKRVLAVLNRNKCKRNLSLPDIRKIANPRLIDFLEAWTKRRIRQMTQSGFGGSVDELDNRIHTMRRPLEIMNRVYKLGASFRRWKLKKGEY